MFQLHSVSVYYNGMKSIIVPWSNGQAFFQLGDKGGCEVVAEAKTISAISLVEQDHNNKPQSNNSVNSGIVWLHLCKECPRFNGDKSLSIDEGSNLAAFV